MPFVHCLREGCINHPPPLCLCLFNVYLTFWLDVKVMKNTNIACKLKLTYICYATTFQIRIYPKSALIIDKISFTYILGSGQISSLLKFPILEFGNEVNDTHSGFKVLHTTTNSIIARLPTTVTILTSLVMTQSWAE